MLIGVEAELSGVLQDVSVGVDEPGTHERPVGVEYLYNFVSGARFRHKSGVEFALTGYESGVVFALTEYESGVVCV